MSSTGYIGTAKEFVELMEAKLNDPNTKFADSEMAGFSSTIQPNIFWKPYCGSKKCKDCDHTADFMAERNDLIIGYSCKKHNFGMKF